MPTPGIEPPIRSLRDARACLDVGLTALGAVVDWIAQFGYRTLAADAARVVAAAGWAVNHVLEHVRDQHPELDDEPPGDDA